MKHLKTAGANNQRYNKTFLLAKALKEKYIFRVHNTQLMVYDKKLGYFKAIQRGDCNTLAYKIMKKNNDFSFSISQLNGVYDALKADKKLYKSFKPVGANLLNCKDCVWDVLNNKYYKHSPKFEFTYYLDAKCCSEKGMDDSLWKKFIVELTCDDKQLKNLLQEWSGYLISSLTIEKKFAMLYGPSNSGKSVYLNVISQIIGKENISNANIKDMNDEKYLSHMCEKRINICNDTNGGVLKDLSNIKQLTSSDDIITTRAIYKAPISVSEKPKLMFASNILPTVTSSCQDLEAYFNRILIIPFMNIVKKPDKELSTKLLENKNAVLIWLGKGLKRYLENNKTFSKCDISDLKLKQYRLEYNIVQEFFNDRLKIKEGKKIFTQDLEKALRSYVTSYDLDYKTDHMNKLRRLLKEKGVENKKIRIGKSAPKQGFEGIKLRK